MDLDAIVEALVELVPVTDSLLPKPPAEKHLAAVIQRGEVDDPSFELLDKASEVLDLPNVVVDALDKPVEIGLHVRDLLSDLVLTTGRVTGVGLGPLLPLLQGFQPRTLGDDLLPAIPNVVNNTA